MDKEDSYRKLLFDKRWLEKRPELFSEIIVNVKFVVQTGIWSSITNSITYIKIPVKNSSHGNMTINILSLYANHVTRKDMIYMIFQ